MAIVTLAVGTYCAYKLAKQIKHKHEDKHSHHHRSSSHSSRDVRSPSPAPSYRERECDCDDCYPDTHNYFSYDDKKSSRKEKKDKKKEKKDYLPPQPLLFEPVKGNALAVPAGPYLNGPHPSPANVGAQKLGLNYDYYHPHPQEVYAARKHSGQSGYSTPLPAYYQ